MKFHTLDDYSGKLKGSKVFVRVDTNATLEKGRLPYTERIKSAFATVTCLLKEGAVVIVGAHNGRAGEASFVSLGPLFLELAAREKDIPDLLCPGNTYDAKKLGLNKETIKLIQGMNKGQILILENLRFLANETAKLTGEEFAKEKFTQDLLEGGVTHCVLDGFSVAHRSHMSIVGFSAVPNIAGLSLERELKGAAKVRELLENNKDGDKNVVFVLGGAKIQDYIDLIERSLRNKTVGKILTGGLLGQLCLFARGHELGEPSKQPLLKKDSKGKTIWDEKERIENLIKEFSEEFVLPVDLAYAMSNGERQEFELSSISEQAKNEGSVFDIGEKTIVLYKEILQNSSMAYWKGPLGAFDKNPNFAKGSREVLCAIKENKEIFSVMGGGDTGQMLQHFATDESELSYVSLSGGALIQVLAGNNLPGIAALQESYHKFPV